MISLSKEKDQQTGVYYITSGVLLLIVAALVCLLVQRGVLRMWPCALHEMTGMYCMTCGVTRAAVSLWNLQILKSLWYNPLPVIFFVSVITVIGFELIGLIRKKRIHIEWIPWVATGTVIVLFIFCILRNVGIIAPI